MCVLLWIENVCKKKLCLYYLYIDFRLNRQVLSCCILKVTHLCIHALSDIAKLNCGRCEITLKNTRYLNLNTVPRNLYFLH